MAIQKKKIFIMAQPVSEDKGIVTLQHFMPELLDEETLSQGILVDFIPEPEVRAGYIPKLMLNYETEEIYYEYDEAPDAPYSIKELEETKARLQATEEALLTLMFEGGM